MHTYRHQIQREVRKQNRSEILILATPKLAVNSNPVIKYTSLTQNYKEIKSTTREFPGGYHGVI